MNRQVLIIDDSPKIHALARATLADQPVDLHSATDPGHGLVLAASLRPDLILLDVNMPGLDGFEACRRLKADAGSADCPVIFLTARDTPAEKVQAFGLGAVDYVTKPFDAAELGARVRASLNTRRTIRTLEATALIDPPTGLGNRAMFDRRLAAEVGLRDRSGHPLSVVAVDVEAVDALRSACGAAGAEQAAGLVAKAVADACRPGDVPCRVDAWRFAVVCPHTTGAEARALGGEIAKRVAEVRVRPPKGTLTAPAGSAVRVAVTVGVASAVEPYDRALLERAQAAMAPAAPAAPVRAA